MSRRGPMPGAAPGARRRAGGFTLVEILIAVGIFALIGVVSAALLTRILEARALSDARAERLAAVQLAVQRIERDLLQWLPRGVRDGFGDPQPALRLQPPASLELTVQGWRNPLGLPRSELQRVAWEFGDDGELLRRFWVVLDRAQDSEARTQTVLTGIENVEFELLDDGGATRRAWPPDEGDAVLLPGEDADGTASPVALRVRLQVPPFGTIERLIPLAVAVEALDDGITAPGEEAEEGEQGAGQEEEGAADDADAGDLSASPEAADDEH
ncbi:MAG TPA: type II secretion system minor pseudopilin GspJ [Pseudomonadales bacterium]|nr:type II secretion system minor pseudopilin GspJ [Pseudomonadales bacterium]